MVVVKVSYALLALCVAIASNSFAQQSAPDSIPEFVIDSIELSGNKTTKTRIILRELEIKQADTLPAAELNALIKRSRDNLLNTSLFNCVEIHTQSIDSVHLTLSVELTERWYTWPIPLFELAETNFNTWWLDKDLNKINYGFYLIRENFRGRKESLKFRFRFGYDQQIAMQYTIPFIDKRQMAGLEFTLGYSFNHEIAYGTVDNKRQFYKSETGYSRKDIFARTALVVRKKLYNRQVINLQYNRASVEDTVLKLAPDFLNGDMSYNEYLSLSWLFMHDKRDYIYYPLSGHVFLMQLTKEGLGIVDHSGLNLLSAYTEFNQHFHIEKKLYFAYGINAKINLLENPPYYYQRGLGYTNFVRGYEYYVIDGQSYGLLKSNMKLALIKEKKGTLKFIKTEKFSKYHYSVFLNLFADAGYVFDGLYAASNPASNSLLIGSGIGLDFLTYYDMVMRVEFSVNRFGESGFFLHFEKPI
ncbi:MAG: POTRA domain-containing protein [Flavobacteriales bacterium]